MITEDYVSLETASLLKEKGFPQDPNMCNTAYSWRGKISNNAKSFWNPFAFEILGRSYYMAPTLQMAMKWLREVHGVYIEILIVGVEWESPTKWYFGWRCQTKDVIDRLRSKDANYISYEEAVEAAIKYSLENLI